MLIPESGCQVLVRGLDWMPGGGIYTDAVDVWAAIADERRGLADQLEPLTSEQWEHPSLCGAWTVRQVVAHLVVPHAVPLTGFVVAVVRSRGSFARANQTLAEREARRPTGDIVADLRRYAEGRFKPPGMGPAAPLTDALIHGLDVRIPLGLPEKTPPEVWGATLDFVVSPLARLGFVSGRLPALGYTASDLDWRHGSGAEVRAPAATLALAMMGRPARLDDLTGPGAAELAAWVRA